MASLRVWTGFRLSRLLSCGSGFVLVPACWRVAFGSTIHRETVQLRHLYPFIGASSFISVVISRVIGCPGPGSCATAPRRHGFLTCLAAHSGAVAPPLISFWCLIGYSCCHDYGGCLFLGLLGLMTCGLVTGLACCFAPVSPK
jgi:hypothetical protein